MLSKLRARRRGGFTLVETIVTVGLLAVIAAFVIPTVIQKAGSGDPVKVQNDLGAVRTALETFATDSKAGFPHQMSALTIRPIVGTSRSIDSTAISANQVAAWNGPYLGATITAAPGDSLATGYTAYIMNFLDRYDSGNNVPEHTAAGAVNGSFAAANPLWVAAQVHGLTPSQAASLNRLFDGGSDPDVAGANTTGRFRYTAPNGGVVVAYYLAVPITQL
jgi:prepilin-type N-terminal cleavage/methylation domain-containing protein